MPFKPPGPPKQKRAIPQAAVKDYPTSVVALLVIQRYAKGRRGFQDNIPCPICHTGRLHFSIAERNGHVWAACTTLKCVSFMQ